MKIIDRRFALASALAVLMLCLATPGLAPLAALGPAAEAEDTVFARMPTSAYEAGGMPALLAIDYGSFVWLELKAADFARLKASGVPLQMAEDAFALRLGGLSFDTRRGAPELPAGWESIRGEGPDLHLVQFIGPTRAEWLDALRSSELKIVQYIHPFTYVVWGETAAVEDALSYDYVHWTGPFAPAYRVLPRWRALPDEPVKVSVLLVRFADTDASIHGIQALGGHLRGRAVLNSIFEITEFVISGALLQNAAQIPGVYSIQPEPTDGGLRGEMSDQINVNNHGPDNLAFPGYLDWLSAAGADGSGVIIANVDGGIQDTHPDLANRMAPCSGDTCGGSASSSHGTHTAGLMAADASSGVKDAYGFFRGLGMAPGANLVEQVYSPWFTYPGGMLKLMTDSYNNGASLSGNSWGPSGSPQGYDNDTMQVDIGVRDADPEAPGNQPLSYILSFMNGNGGYQTQGTPDEAKNIFTIGSTKMQFSNGQQILEIDDLSSNSAHGPALDGRLIPHMVAPGCSVDSTVPTNSYDLMCGTSMASPHVSGAVALFIEYYRNLFSVDPSAALIKAAFLPVAHDLAGHDDADGNPLGHPFDYRQGWGRMDTAAVVSPTVLVEYFDSEVIFDNTGEVWETTLGVADPSQPVRLMLVWTDAPGHGLGGNTPAWNNDLDLEVEVGGDIYRGNDFDDDGWSQPGGGADPRNNTEGVFLGPTPPGSLTVRVVASDINSDGIPNQGDDTDQDFALACYNCALVADFTLDADPDTFAVCAPDVANSTIHVGQILDYPHDVTLEMQDLPPGVNSDLDPEVVTPPGQSALTLDVTGATVDGSYTLLVVGTAEGSNVHTADVVLDVSSSTPGAPSLLSPTDGATGQSYEELTFTWEELPQVHNYSLQVDTLPSFPAPVVDVTGMSQPTYTVAGGLDPATCYFWRAKGTNACGEGAWADPFRFATVLVDRVFLDDVEGGGASWTATGLWHITTTPDDPCAEAHSGSSSWYYGQEPECNYDAGTNSGTLTLNMPIDLSGATTPATLRFWSWEQTEDEGGYDTRRVYLSDNGYTWTQVWDSTSNAASWYQVELDVSTYVGGDLHIRFEFDTGDNLYNNYRGWYVDDVEVLAGLPPFEPPTLLSIDPDTGAPDEPTPVTITGAGFQPTPVVLLGETPLLNVTYVNDSTLTAVVPEGMPEGIYDLVLYNPDCQEAVLADAFTIASGATTMHVDGIKLRYRERNGRYVVFSTLRILDEDGWKVDGATVGVEWTLPDASALIQEALTNVRGLARYRLRSTQTGTFEICVTGVVKAGYVYDPSQNSETCDTIDVP